MYWQASIPLVCSFLAADEFMHDGVLKTGAGTGFA